MKNERQVEVLTDFVTTGYLCKLFGRCSLTITNWRNNEGLPYVEIPGEGKPSIRYRLSKVRKWAKSNSKRMHLVEQEV